MSKITNPSKLSIIVAMDENRGIGYKGKIPWDIPEDRKWFREKTLGHVVIMGRKTYDSIMAFLKKPLPGRINIVVTRDKSYKTLDGVSVVHSIEEAIDVAKKKEKNGEIFVIGGAEIYKEFLPNTDRLYVTEVKGEYDADTYFPKWEGFKLISEESHKNKDYAFNFKVFERE